MDWPEIAELRDVTLGSLSFGSSKSEMALPAEPPTPLLGHFRYGGPDSYIKILRFDDPRALSVPLVTGPVIYGGPLFRHFGHALSESIHRLWPRFALDVLRSARVVFAPVNDSKIYPYVTEALNLHGISKRQVIRLTEPMRFSQLFVGPQARQMAGPTIIDDYPTMLDASLNARLGPAGGDGRLYVSRLHHHHTGSFYGESWIESILAADGFEIIYPEQHSLSDLVRALRSSTVAVFAEGSAIHALELCGSAAPDVFVIGRRSQSVDRFRPLLSNICRRWTVSDRLLFNAGMSDDPKKHSGVVDLAAVLEDLSSFLRLEHRSNHGADLSSAMHFDIERHIADPRLPRTSDYELRAQRLRSLARSAITDLGRPFL